MTRQKIALVVGQDFSRVFFGLDAVFQDVNLVHELPQCQQTAVTFDTASVEREDTGIPRVVNSLCPCLCCFCCGRYVMVVCRTLLRRRLSLFHIAPWGCRWRRHDTIRARFTSHEPKARVNQRTG